MRPLPPIEVPWSLKSVESAESGLERLAGGRRRFWIRHELLRGVTPPMLLHWFRHLEGEMTLAGRRVERYRVWHPRDHVAVRYAQRCPDGGIGPGARIHIRELFGAKPENAIDVIATIERLDLGGFVHVDHVLGVAVGRMSYRFTPVEGGTLYENELVVGFESRALSALNGMAGRFFSDEKGRAWIRHNIEEVGAFEQFLPALYEEEAGG